MDVYRIYFPTTSTDLLKLMMSYLSSLLLWQKPGMDLADTYITFVRQNQDILRDRVSDEMYTEKIFDVSSVFRAFTSVPFICVQMSFSWIRTKIGFLWFAYSQISQMSWVISDGTMSVIILFRISCDNLEENNEIRARPWRGLDSNLHFSSEHHASTCPGNVQCQATDTNLEDFIIM